MISVIMGVYNQQDLEVFEKAVNSVLQQTYRNFEFLIYNDGSSIKKVNTYMKELESKDSRIRVIGSKAGSSGRTPSPPMPLSSTSLQFVPHHIYS